MIYRNNFFQYKIRFEIRAFGTSSVKFNKKCECLTQNESYSDNLPLF